MQLQVGDKRKFSFTDIKYSIREIIELPEIKMKWNWDSCVCPHCKNKITQEIEHTFYSIEILGNESVLDEDLKLKEVIFLGHTTDGRIMILPKQKMIEALSLSKKFGDSILGE